MTNCVRILTVVLVLATCAAAADDQTLRLDEAGKLQPISPENDELRLAISKAKELVVAGDAEAAQAAYENVKKLIADDPNNTLGEDLDIFIEAEMYFADGKLTKAVRTYDKILNEHRRSPLFEAAMDREFQIATAYLGGHKKKLIAFIKIRGYAEGVKMMEKLAERAQDDSLKLRAHRAIAQHYEQRKLFLDAHVEWEFIRSQWGLGPVGSEALEAMARNKHAAYNKKPEARRAHYDGSPLISARSYYQELQQLYPITADKVAADEVIVEIDEQLAEKKFTVAKYYLKIEELKAADIYFDMILKKWPDTKAAELTRQIVNSRTKNEAEDEDNQG